MPEPATLDLSDLPDQGFDLSDLPDAPGNIDLNNRPVVHDLAAGVDLSDLPDQGGPSLLERGYAALQEFDKKAQRGVRRTFNLPIEGPLTAQDLGEILTPSHPIVGREFLPREERETKGVADTVGKAGYNLLVDTANFFNSPEGAAITLATGGAGAIEPAIARFAALGFGADSARNAIDAAVQGRWADALESLGMTGLLAKGAHSEAKHSFPLARPEPGVIAPETAARVGLEQIDLSDIPDQQPFTPAPATFMPGEAPPAARVGLEQIDLSDIPDQQPFTPAPATFAPGEAPPADVASEPAPQPAAAPEPQPAAPQLAPEPQPAPQQPPTQAAPSVALDTIISQLPETRSAPAEAGDVFKVPTKQIAARPDLLQYKAMTDEAAGTKEENLAELGDKFDPHKAGNLLLWEPTNPKEYGLTDEQKYIVANGHHRLAKYRGQTPAFNSQILRESAGVTLHDAFLTAAEANIADGKGTIYDAADLIRGLAETDGPDQALARARKIGARSGKAASIALNSGPDLYTSFLNERITPDAAASIADAAPGNNGLQRIGIKAALEGEKPADIFNFLQAAQAREPIETAEQADMFGSNDAALNAAKEAGKRAGAIQSELDEQIRAVSGAAKRPEKARALGVDIADPETVNAKLAQLRELQERARMWRNDPQIRDMAFGEITAQDAVKELTKPPEAPPESGDLARPQDDFNFEPIESDAEMIARQKREAEQNAKLQAEADKKAQAQYGWQQKLTGDAGDLGQQELGGDIPGQKELFAPEPPALGGERQEPPPGSKPHPADDPAFTALPVDLPEAVRFNNELLKVAISVKEKLKALSGQAAGVFKFGAGKGEIHLRADMADLLAPEDKANLMAEAQAYAEHFAEKPAEIKGIAKARYEYLLSEAYREAKTKPPLRALKVIWHEIGHAVDYMAHAAEVSGLTKREIHGRGNLFGHIAALHDYLKGVIALDPVKPTGKPIDSRGQAKLLKEAAAQLRKELGPIADIIETITVEEPELRIVGVTPSDVTNLFGMDAREAMPELYKWFAEQSAQIKKEIVLKAMRGLLDERLAAMGKTERIGTRTVERTVHRKIGREPTQQEISERFRQLFRDELQRRNLAELKTVKAELEGAIAWWHGTEKMPAYFGTPEEMYAESFSIFMNNPAALAKRAPTYSRLIWNYMDHRPEVADVYNKLQNEIKSGQTKDVTERLMLDSWDAADKHALDQARRHEAGGKWRDFLDNVSYHIDRRFGPIYRAARGAQNEGSLRAAIGNFLYRTSEHELILNRINREVGVPMVKQNLDWKDLGRYMFYKRVVEERYKIFNPYGIAPDRAINRLANMRETFGDRKFAALEDAHRAFRKIYEERVAGPMRAERMWSPELQDAIDRNLFYATFDVRKDEAGVTEDGISRLLSVRYGNLGGHIYRQIGTVKDIKNPATATVLKALSLTSAVARNAVKRETIAALRDADKTNVVEASKRWTGKTWEYVPADNSNVGTIVYLHDGKPQAFYVRKVVADAINGGNHIQNRLTLAAVHATSALKGLFTQLNYAFWPVNFMRDTAGWVMQLPGATPVSWAREFPAAIKAARASVKGTANPHADAALKRRMMISRADPAGIWSAAENEYEVKLASYGLNPASWTKEAEQVHGIVKAWNSYREFGQVIERVNKISAMNYIDRHFPDMPEWKKAEIVRERGGSPDFLQRGASNAYVDFFMMFYNPWKEAARSVTRAARENPWSFAAKTTAFVAMPTVMQVLANAGVFGNDTEKKYRSIPDYDLSNYLVIPLGWVGDKKQGKVAYLRLPLWEPARILHQSIWGMATGRGQGLLSLYGGTLPSMNAMLNVAQMWAQYEIFGKNPYDSFRGKSVLNDTTFAVAGWPARKELLKYSWNSLGGAIVHRFQNEQLDNPPSTDMEKFLALPIINNALNRWVKVSNRGLGDADRTITAPMEKQRATMRLAVQEMQRKVLTHEALTPNERLLLRDPYAAQYYLDTYQQVWISRNLPMQRRLQGKPQAEQLLILQQMMGEQEQQ